jgi:hypothetical protein
MFGDVTVDQALELGLFVCGTAATVRKAFENYWTASDYESVIETHLLPASKGWRLADIQVPDVETLRGDLLKKVVPGPKRRKLKDARASELHLRSLPRAEN